MKYLCLECRKIWELRSSAAACCQPAVSALTDEDVMPCDRNGLRCEDEDCQYCQGTGWRWKPTETYKGLMGD